MTKQWKITIDRKDYTVELAHNTWTNVQKIHINSQAIYESPGKLQIGGVTCFSIEGHECAVIVSNKMLSFDYDLVVDGVSVTTQKKVKYQATKPVATIVKGVVHQTTESKRK